MAMFKAGEGRGPAVHLYRSRALEELDRASLLRFTRYTGSPRGKYVVESRGAEYEMDPQEVNSYVIGVDDAYMRVRAEVIRVIDEMGPRHDYDGDYSMRVARALDERLGRALHTAAEPFLADRAVRANSDGSLAEAS